MKANFFREVFKDLEPLNLKKEVNKKEIGLIINCMERELKLKQTELVMKEITLKICDAVKEF